jgi:beta-lactamase superfamily II metal-dependent hydrolase
MRNLRRVVFGLVASLALLAPVGLWADATPRGLDIYFIDTEGGAATLIVTPAGESILIDSGNPGDRDAHRIAAAARDAGITEIDHYVTTHWHSDHVGGAAPLSKLLPIKAHYGHAIPNPLPDDISASLMDAWKGLGGELQFLLPGDTFKFTSERGTPKVHMKVLAADGLVLGEKEGAPQVTTCDDGNKPRDEDKSDNARSLAMVLSYGKFDLFAGGDLTWNVEHKLTCPKLLVPKVDVYLVDHHGLDLSNNPTLIAALAPEVAIVNNGPRKGADPDTMKTLLSQLGEIGVFQLHRNVRPGALNTDTARIANTEEICGGSYIHLHVDRNGEHYTVAVPSRESVRDYDAR